MSWLPGKYVLILYDIRGDPPMNVKDYRDIKDFIRSLFVPIVEPGRTNISDNDRAFATTDYDNWHKAFQAFNALNGHPWRGTRLEAILQYPDETTWLIHPATDPTASVPLVRRYRASSGAGFPFIAPQLARERRTPSISSVSSQTSSRGSLSSIGSPGLSPPFPVFASYEQLTPASAVIDTRSGAIVPPDGAAGYLSASQADGSGRFQSFLMISNAGAQSPTQMSPRPRYEFQTERRMVIVRELSHDVTEKKLQGLLEARDLANHTRSSEAREAVRKLHRYRFMERNLQVKLAQEQSTVRQTDTSWPSQPGLNTPQRPIIADGSIQGKSKEGLKSIEAGD